MTEQSETQSSSRKVRDQLRECVGTLVGNRWLVVDTHLNLYKHLVKVLTAGAFVVIRGADWTKSHFFAQNLL